jgi:hypothetical protein
MAKAEATVLVEKLRVSQKSHQMNGIQMCILLTAKARDAAGWTALALENALRVDPHDEERLVDHDLLAANQHELDRLRLECRLMEDAVSRLQSLLSEWSERRGENGCTAEA